jgi:hypothetical protein
MVVYLAFTEDYRSEKQERETAFDKVEKDDKWWTNKAYYEVHHEKDLLSHRLVYTYGESACADGVTRRRCPSVVSFGAYQPVRMTWRSRTSLLRYIPRRSCTGGHCRSRVLLRGVLNIWKTIACREMLPFSCLPLPIHSDFHHKTYDIFR